jgi:hypothetical protein
MAWFLQHSFRKNLAIFKAFVLKKRRFFHKIQSIARVTRTAKTDDYSSLEYQKNCCEGFM